MAQEIYRFGITIPPGTLSTAPAKVPIKFPPREVDEIEIVVPSGARGEMGFAVAMSGTAIIPTNQPGFIVTDDEKIRWPVEGFPDSGAWEVWGFNNGQLPHSLEIRFLVHLPGAGPAAILPLPADALTPAPVDTLPPPDLSLPPPPDFTPPAIPPPPDLPPPPPLSDVGLFPVGFLPPGLTTLDGTVIPSAQLSDDALVWLYQVSHLLAYGDFGTPQAQRDFVNVIRGGQVGLNDIFSSWWQDGAKQGRAYSRSAGS